MQIPVQITLRDLEPSSVLEEHIRKKVEKLERYHDRIIACKVVVEFIKKHQHHGKLYTVHVDLAIPGDELAVTKKVNEDVYVALRDAFEALTQQLRKRHERI